MDQSFRDLIRQHPRLGELRRYLPENGSGAAFAGQAEIDSLPSSYSFRGYGAVIYALVRVLQPRSAVEIGIYQGYSLLSTAAALRDNGAGKITGYDLFDAYPYRHAERDQVTRQVARSGLQDWVAIEASDIDDVHERWESVDFLHVDVSNNGDTYRRVFDHWSRRVRQVIVLEGGSTERDNVAWMLRYQKPAIAPALADLERAHPGWSFTVLAPFPSLTVAFNRTAAAAAPV